MTTLINDITNLLKHQKCHLNNNKSCKLDKSEDVSGKQYSNTVFFLLLLICLDIIAEKTCIRRAREKLLINLCQNYANTRSSKDTGVVCNQPGVVK